MYIFRYSQKAQGKRHYWQHTNTSILRKQQKEQNTGLSSQNKRCHVCDKQPPWSHKSKMQEVKTHLDVYLFHFYGQFSSKCNLHQPSLFSKHFFRLQILRTNLLETRGKWIKAKTENILWKAYYIQSCFFITMPESPLRHQHSSWCDAVRQWPQTSAGLSYRGLHKDLKLISK